MAWLRTSLAFASIGIAITQLCVFPPLCFYFVINADTGQLPTQYHRRRPYERCLQPAPADGQAARRDFSGDQYCDAGGGVSSVFREPALDYKGEVSGE